MTDHQQTSRCRIISIASACPHIRQSPLARILGQRVMDLAELSRVIGVESDLGRRIKEAACQEFGYPLLSLEEAIVMLGRQGLYRFLGDAVPCNPRRSGRSARQLRLNISHTTPAATLHPLVVFQGEAK